MMLLSVIENTHRVFDNGKVPIRKAAKIAAGEIFIPVFSGTLVVLAPFVPLAFWPGVIGKFMMFLPITLIIALLASLVVAYIINPVFAADFMKPHEHEHNKKPTVTKGLKITAIVLGSIALLSYLIGVKGFGNFIVFLFVIYALHHFFIAGVITRFQTNVWPRVQARYKNLVVWCVQRYRPIWIAVSMIFSLFFRSYLQESENLLSYFSHRATLTSSTHTSGCRSEQISELLTRLQIVVEERVTKVVGKDNPMVESIISNVAIGASEDPMEGGGTLAVHTLAKVAVAFVKFSQRDGQSTKVYMDKIRDAVKGIKGAEVSVNQEQGGPPTGKPINIEISGDNFQLLASTSGRLKRYLDSLQIPGIEELKSDFQSDKPEINIKIDREKANREGISTQSIGRVLGTAVYGAEVSRFRDENDDYPISCGFVRISEMM
jgi:multidrug efflux pump subunit AcrB